ncbi:DsbA family protein [Loigolactobacillus zhaoyuanensis]|uniref:DsbA family protein n=1 Tax=Loigolactobacillus zhaoyuanensis TaxID=2486017 RepID=A0ABW8UHH0_9LACO|nr:DsbA family protein [Loigolactobacillus zhaoyuanensis]
MLEIYLFVNPLGEHCLEAERSVLKIAEEHRDTVHYQFLPLVNLHTVDDVMQRSKFDARDLKMRNKVFQTIYAAALDYKAALFQGKRRGQEFLMTLQNELNFHHERYTDQLITSLAGTNGLDAEMFHTDRRSKLAIESFEADQRIACEMQIQHHPSAVIYNYADPTQDYGIMIEDCHSYEVLKQVCQGNYDAALAAQNSTNIRKQTIHIL